MRKEGGPTMRTGKSGGAGGGSELNGGGARGGHVWNIFLIGLPYEEGSLKGRGEGEERGEEKTLKSWEKTLKSEETEMREERSLTIGEKRALKREETQGREERDAEREKVVEADNQGLIRIHQRHAFTSITNPTTDNYLACQSLVFE